MDRNQYTTSINIQRRAQNWKKTYKANTHNWNLFCFSWNDPISAGRWSTNKWIKKYTFCIAQNATCLYCTKSLYINKLLFNLCGDHLCFYLFDSFFRFLFQKLEKHIRRAPVNYTTNALVLFHFRFSRKTYFYNVGVFMTQWLQITFIFYWENKTL